ncbi:hypothetical protein ABH972_001766 [Bradyrhizobium ottawaense]
MEADAARTGRRLKQLQELTLGRLQRRIRHVVDEPDRELSAVIAREIALGRHQRRARYDLIPVDQDRH